MTAEEWLEANATHICDRHGCRMRPEVCRERKAKARSFGYVVQMSVEEYCRNCAGPRPIGAPPKPLAKPAPKPLKTEKTVLPEYIKIICPKCKQARKISKKSFRRHTYGVGMPVDGVFHHICLRCSRKQPRGKRK